MFKYVNVPIKKKTSRLMSSSSLEITASNSSTENRSCTSSSFSKLKKIMHNMRALGA